MNMSLDNEKEALVDEVRSFVEREVLPIAHAMEHADQYPETLVEKLKHLGIFSATIPEAYGGLGLDFSTYARIIEQLARGWMSPAGIVNTHIPVAYMITTYCSEGQRPHFPPVIATRGQTGAPCLSQTHAGEA